MEINLPAKLEGEARRCLDDWIASGRFPDAGHAVAAAVLTLRTQEEAIEFETEAEKQRLREMVQVGLDQLDRGEYDVLDVDDIKDRIQRQLDREQQREAG